MFSQRLPNPPILPVVCTDNDDKVVSSCIVGVEEVRDYSKQAQTASEDDELIFAVKLVVKVLLIFLVLSALADLWSVYCIY